MLGDKFNVVYIIPFQNHFDGMNLFKTCKLTLLREFEIQMHFIHSFEIEYIQNEVELQKGKERRL